MTAEFGMSAIDASLRTGVITIARCADCGAEHAFPTPSCFDCGSTKLDIAEHPGTGSVFSWVVNHHAFGSEEADSPYTVLLVELDGGARLYARLRDDAAVRSKLAGGVRVAIDRSLTGAAGHPVFALAEQASDLTLDPALTRTCYRALSETAKTRGAHPALAIIGYQTLTYSELLARVDQCAAMLEGREVGKGHRVAVMSNNRCEVLEIWLACSRIGAVFVPFNPALRGPILADMIALADPGLTICEPEWTERFAAAAPTIPAIELVEFGEGRFTDWGDGSPTAVSRDPDALTIIMFTSGTTGRSKGVMWSSVTINAMAHQVAATIGFASDDLLHTALPMFHGNALILSVYNAITLGATAVVSRKFSASGFESDLEQSGATATSFLGSMTNMVLGRSPERQFQGTLRKALVIPAPEPTIAAVEQRFDCKVATAYGLADAGMPLFSGLRFPYGTCGRVFETLWDARIVDLDGNEVALGAVGELAVRPRSIRIAALGYWRMPDATESSRRDGWIRTGDLMRRDAEGWFYFVDRGKDSIRRRGENVSSQEVETVFEGHPAVLECAVYPVPSDMSEDEIMLAVVLRPGVGVKPLDLIMFAEPKLPYFAIPRFVRFMEQLPKNSTEKVLKAELRKAGIVSGSFDLDASAHKVAR